MTKVPKRISGKNHRMVPTDPDTINQVKEWFEAHHRFVYHIARRMLHDETRAEDVVQEVFIKVFHAAEQFRGDSKVSTWIYRITINTCLSMIKKEKYHERGLFKLWKNEQVHPPTEPFQQVEEQDLVDYILCKIPEKYRILLILRELDGLKPVEIMEITELSPSTYKIRMGRAKEMLITALNQHVQENGYEMQPN
jgi:RNA polymerase sigma-70 factor, ECF subfamily